VENNEDTNLIVPSESEAGTKADLSSSQMSYRYDGTYQSRSSRRMEGSQSCLYVGVSSVLTLPRLHSLKMGGLLQESCPVISLKSISILRIVFWKKSLWILRPITTLELSKYSFVLKEPQPHTLLGSRSFREAW